MRYSFVIDGQTTHAELDAAQVAKLAAAGIELLVLRRRYYTRDGEKHVGEYTDAEHDALLAEGWELLKVLADGEDVEPERPATPPPVYHYSKLKILRALIAHGQDSAFFDWLDSDRSLRTQWDAASYIASDDPVFGAALSTFVGAVKLPDGVTVEQVLEGCRV